VTLTRKHYLIPHDTTYFISTSPGQWCPRSGPWCSGYSRREDKRHQLTQYLVAWASVVRARASHGDGGPRRHGHHNCPSTHRLGFSPSAQFAVRIRGWWRRRSGTEGEGDDQLSDEPRWGFVVSFTVYEIWLRDFTCVWNMIVYNYYPKN
jgi:hypothetical protein